MDGLRRCINGLTTATPWRIVVASSNTKGIPTPTGTAMTATSTFDSYDALSYHYIQSPSHHFCSTPRTSPNGRSE